MNTTEDLKMLVIMEPRHSLTPSIKVLGEFKGCFLEETRVVSPSGKTLAKGIATMISGSSFDVRNWLEANEPVWYGVGNPMLEQYNKFTTKFELPNAKILEHYGRDWPRERKEMGRIRFGQWFINHYQLDHNSDIFYETHNEKALSMVLDRFSDEQS